MRLDYKLYALAVVFFVITLASTLFPETISRTLILLSSAVLGVICLAFGYTKKSQSTPRTSQLPPPPLDMPATPPQPTEVTIVEAQKQEEQPQSPITLTEAQTTQNPIADTPATKETITPDVQPAITEPLTCTTQTSEVNMPKPGLELTQVSGIGEKRASQLKTVGINTVDDLANASVEDLAKSLKTSPKIVAKWVASAKGIQQKVNYSPLTGRASSIKSG